jgi:1-phosphofructokinase
MSAEAQIVTVTLNPAIDWTLQIPGFAAGRVNRVAGERTLPAGKGVNVAAALATAGAQRIVATGFLGRDNAAEFGRFLRERGIGEEFVRVNGATRTGIKIVDPQRQETTDINFPGAPVTDAELAELGTRIDQLASARPIFVLAGSVPPGVSEAIYQQMTIHLRERGCRVILDTSGAPLQHAVDARPDVIKPNIHELEAVVGTPLRDQSDVVAAARALCDHGIGLVVVSMGADGAVFVDRRNALLARPPAIAVNSSVGAGDAMVAGIVVALLASSSLEETARVATAFSLHALTAGERDLRAFAEMVAITSA